MPEEKKKGSDAPGPGRFISESEAAAKIAKALEIAELQKRVREIGEQLGIGPQIELALARARGIRAESGDLLDLAVDGTTREELIAIAYRDGKEAGREKARREEIAKGRAELLDELVRAGLLTPEAAAGFAARTP